MDKICKTPDCIRNLARQLLNAPDESIMTVSHDNFLLDTDDKYGSIFVDMPFAEIGDNEAGLKLKSKVLSKLHGYASKLPNRAYYDWFLYTEAIDHLTESGKAVGIMMNSCTFETRYKEIIKYFIDNGLIEAVIALPNSLFDGTRVSASFIVLSHNNKEIAFVDARNQFQSESKIKNVLTQENIETIVSASTSETEISSIVSYDDVVKNKYEIYPTTYLNTKTKVENGVEFGTLIKNVICGLQITPDKLKELTSETETKYQYLCPNDVRSGISEMSLPHLTGVTDAYMNHCIKNRSLIITKIGSPKITVAKVSGENDIIAVGRLYVLELDEEKVNPYYVKAYLESSQGQDALEACDGGSTIRNIKLDLLKKLQIPMISIEEQNKFINKIW